MRRLDKWPRGRAIRTRWVPGTHTVSLYRLAHRIHAGKSNQAGAWVGLQGINAWRTLHVLDLATGAAGGC